MNVSFQMAEMSGGAYVNNRWIIWNNVNNKVLEFLPSGGWKEIGEYPRISTEEAVIQYGRRMIE